MVKAAGGVADGADALHKIPGPGPAIGGAVGGLRVGAGAIWEDVSPEAVVRGLRRERWFGIIMGATEEIKQLRHYCPHSLAIVAVCPKLSLAWIIVGRSEDATQGTPTIGECGATEQQHGRALLHLGWSDGLVSNHLGSSDAAVETRHARVLLVRNGLAALVDENPLGAAAVAWSLRR